MKEVMIDIETFDNKFHSAICQFGGVYFNRTTGETGDELLINIDAGSAQREGLTISAETLYWWLSQSVEAQQSILKEPRINIRNAMNTINTFLKKADTIWSHATFDFVIVMTTLNVLEIPPKFNYRNARDIRTLIDLAGGYSNVHWEHREGTHHNALDDAKFQVKYCVEAVSRLNKVEIRLVQTGPCLMCGGVHPDGMMCPNFVVGANKSHGYTEWGIK